ncbi:MAG TPA: SGNH/GDSL hydrolase family protein [Steroidobacteraceae bacterium]|jgi:lysophospholipase L1-like esterase
MSSHSRELVLALLMSAALGACAMAQNQGTKHGQGPGWVTAWGASPETPPANEASYSGQTLRLIVHTSLNGDRIRVRLSNRFGTAPLVVGAAEVGLRQSGAAVVAGSNRAVTFSGMRSITIPAGALAVSDPVDLPLPPSADLAVSVFIAHSVGAATIHALALQTSYVSGAGDFAQSDGAAAFDQTIQSWPFLSAVEVHAEGARAVVTFGDSITDGYKSTPDANHRWPDRFASRLIASGRKFAVVNEGISGNRMYFDGTSERPIFGPNGLSRFDRDVLAAPGVTHVVVLLGINDIGQPGALGLQEQQVSADQLIAGYRQLIARAHALGLKIIGATLTPFDTFNLAPGYFSAAGEAKRQAVNTWIRTGKEFDGIIDFDAAVRDPNHPSQFLPAYDSGDHLHPNDAGYKAMAEAVDLLMF